MAKEKEHLLDLKTIIATAIGGIMLLISTVFLSSFISSPPSRAEFDSLKSEILSTQKSIDDRLKNIEAGQKTVIEYLINKGR